MAQRTSTATAWAQRADRLLQRLERIGLNEASLLARRMQRSTQQAVLAGQPLDQALSGYFQEFAGLLEQAMAAAHLQALLWVASRAAGAIRARRMARTASAYKEALAYLQRRLAFDPEKTMELQSAYREAALGLAADAQRVLVEALNQKILEAAQAAIHLEGGIQLVRQAFQQVGMDPGSNHLLAQIFRTQTSLAYHAGQWVANRDAAIQEILWGYEYVTVGDDRVRPNHLALEGTRLPKSDPLWRSIWPPNGYNCRCKVIEVFYDQNTMIEYPLYSVEIDGRIWTGEPDPGWNFNPGETALYACKVALPVPVESVRPSEEPEPIKPSHQVPLPEGFPRDPTKLRRVRSLGGSTGAVLMQDEQGQLFVVKRGASPEHIREEYLAERLYRALGVPVPDSQLYETPEGPIKISRYLADAQPLYQLTGEQRRRAIAQLHRHFVADALLGNWDVLGLAEDNVLVTRTGTVWRVDVGGALRFRAQGLSKGAAFDRWPLELWTMRDPGIARQAAGIFGDMEFSDILEQAQQVLEKEEAVLRLVEDEDLAATLAGRFQELREIVRTGTNMLQDGFLPEYVDLFSLDKLKVRQEGLLAPAAETSYSIQEGGRLVDGNGQPWAGLRGPGSVSEEFWGFIKDHGGDPHLVEAVLDRWGSSTGNVEAHGLRYWWRQQCPGRRQFFLDINLQKEKRAWQSLVRRWGRDKLDRTFRLVHAFTVELLRTCDIPNNDRVQGLVRIARREAEKVVGSYKVGQQVRLIRYPLCSHFLAYSQTTQGNTLTVCQVPHERVFFTYLIAKREQPNRTLLFSDTENEILADSALESMEVIDVKTRRFSICEPGVSGDGSPELRGRVGSDRSDQTGYGYAAGEAEVHLVWG